MNPQNKEYKKRILLIKFINYKLILLMSKEGVFGEKENWEEEDLVKAPLMGAVLGQSIREQKSRYQVTVARTPLIKGYLNLLTLMHALLPCAAASWNSTTTILRLILGFFFLLSRKSIQMVK